MKTDKSLITSIRVILALVLCLTLLPAAAFADDSSAGTDTGTPAVTADSGDAAAQETPAPAPNTVKSLKQDGLTLEFKENNVLIDKPLTRNSEPFGVKYKKKGKKAMKVTWNKAVKPGSVDGYIILRKTGKAKKYVEVGRVSSLRKSFKDKKTPKAKKQYKYTIVGFKKNGEYIRISPCSDTGTIYGDRKYQNPIKYVQITNKISKHGHSYYTSPVLVNNKSTKKDHIEAMIRTARKYLGDPYVVCQSRAPGKGVDCSGLVMQACYGAGVDLWPSNPARHRYPAYEYESRNIARMSNLRTVSFKERKRGDLVFYANSNGTVIHVAIYIGNDRIIHSDFAGVRISSVHWGGGHIKKLKRIFN